jgi:hypothetical protein
MNESSALDILRLIIPQPYREMLKICSKSKTITLSDIDSVIIIKAIELLKYK